MKASTVPQRRGLSWWWMAFPVLAALLLTVPLAISITSTATQPTPKVIFCINEDLATCATIGDVIKLQSGGAFVMVYQPVCNDAIIAEAVTTSVAVLVDGKMAAVSQYQGEQCVANLLVQRAGRPLPLIFAYSADPQRRTGMVRNNGATAELDPTRPVAGFDQILRWLATVP